MRPAAVAAATRRRHVQAAAPPPRTGDMRASTSGCTSASTRASTRASGQPSLLLPLAMSVLLHVLQSAAAATAPAHHGDSAPLAAPELKAATAMDVLSGHSVHARDVSDPKEPASQVALPTGDGPRRRQQLDFVGPSLLLGGTLAALMLAAIGHLASKALLASMLSAALSAVQLARPPPPNRPG